MWLCSQHSEPSASQETMHHKGSCNKHRNDDELVSKLPMKAGKVDEEKDKDQHKLQEHGIRKLHITHIHVVATSLGSDMDLKLVGMSPSLPAVC